MTFVIGLSFNEMCIAGELEGLLLKMKYTKDQVFKF